MTSSPTPARVATALSVGGAAAVVASLFLPWARSGQADRSGFELARTVDALGLARPVPLRVLLVALWMAPLLAAVSWTLAALGRRAPAVASAAIVSAVGIASAVLVFRSEAVRPRLGPWVAMLAGTIALAGALRLATTRGR